MATEQKKPSLPRPTAGKPGDAPQRPQGDAPAPTPAEAPAGSKRSRETAQGIGSGSAPPPASDSGTEAVLEPPPPDNSTPGQATLRPGDVVAGKYRVDSIVGFGGMGFVVEAWHLSFEERVAIKLLRKEVIANEEALVRFEREARAAFKIKSEHVARVIDVGRLDNDAPYMVMEYLEGTDLGALLADRRTLPIAEAVDYILQTCEAIAEAHSLGIIHRDLKPENLFLTERRDGAQCIKVLDFGLSKVMPKHESAQRERALTATKQVMGTAEYMSPEQWLSARDVEPPTDIWSLGVILFELIAGHTPFERDQMAQMCQAILGGEPPRLQSLRPDAPAGLEAVILGCLEKDPAHRVDVAEFARGIAPFGPPGSDAAAARIASLIRGGGRVDSGAPPAVVSSPGSAPEPVPSGPGSIPAPGVPSVPPATSQPAPSSAHELGRVIPPHSWAEILRERPHRPKSAGGGNAVGAGLVLLLLVIVAGLVWTNRSALDPPPPAAEGSEGGAPAAAGTVSASTSIPASATVRPARTAAPR